MTERVVRLHPPTLYFPLRAPQIPSGFCHHIVRLGDFLASGFNRSVNNIVYHCPSHFPNIIGVLETLRQKHLQAPFPSRTPAGPSLAEIMYFLTVLVWISPYGASGYPAHVMISSPRSFKKKKKSHHVPPLLNDSSITLRISSRVVAKRHVPVNRSPTACGPPALLPSSSFNPLLPLKGTTCALPKVSCGFMRAFFIA